MKTTTIGAILIRAGWPRVRCAYCPKRLPLREIVLDHVTPRRPMRGGDRKDGRVRGRATSLSHNIVPCCINCNGMKGGRDPRQLVEDGAIGIDVYYRLLAQLTTPLDRKRGRRLGDKLYPWAPAYRAKDTAQAKIRQARARAEVARLPF